jgi:hypothetical protein
MIGDTYLRKEIENNPPSPASGMGERGVILNAAGLGLAGIGFDLLEKLNHFVCFSDVNDRHIRDDTCDKQQAAHDVLHRNLPQSRSKLAVIIHKPEEIAIPDFALPSLLFS